MRNLSIVFALLLIFATGSFAFPSDFPSSCYPPSQLFQINGFNFTVAPIGTSCVARTNYTYAAGNMSYLLVNEFHPNGNPAGIYELDLLNFPIGSYWFYQNASFGGGQAASTYPTITINNAVWTTPTGNYVMNLTSFTNNALTVQFTNSTGSSIAATGTTYFNYSVNTTSNCIVITNSTSSTVGSCGFLNITVSVNTTGDNLATQTGTYLSNFPNFTLTIQEPSISNFTTLTKNLNNFFSLSMYVASDNTTNVRTDALPVNLTLSPPSTGKYRAYVLYSNNVLGTKLTYFPGVAAWPSFMNNSDGTLFMLNNTAAYIINPNDLNCYFVPPFAASDLSIIYTETASLCTQQASAAFVSNPTVYLSTNCYQNGNNYVTAIRTVSNQTYNLQTVDVNNVVTNTPYTTNYLNVTTPLTNLTSVFVTNSNISVCKYVVGSTVFFNQDISFMNTSLNKIIGTILILGMFVLSAMVPLAAIPAVALNDIFRILSIDQVMQIFGFSAVIGILNAYYGDRTMKAIGIYLALSAAIVLRLLALAGSTETSGCSYTDTSGVIQYCGNTIFTALTTLNSNTTNINLNNFLNTIPLFLITIITFILSLPVIISGTVMWALNGIFPPLATAFSMFSGVFTLGLYLWILLKGYEVISNRFRAL